MPMIKNVLSLFDGISCGQLALTKASVKYERYFASEIEAKSIRITQKNFPSTIQLGDVTQIDSYTLPEIDLLIGGSPCQGFSLCGFQKAFEDPRSKLFFDFVRLLYELNPKYFLFENVPMKKEYQKIISYWLDCEPILINSADFSAQNRRRLYWTNIQIPPWKIINLAIKDILDETYEEKNDITWRVHNKIKGPRAVAWCAAHMRGLCEKARCLTYGGQEITNAGSTNVYISDNEIYKLSPTECERLQTIPVGYTGGEKDSVRCKIIGNSWTVDVIAHILSGLV